MEQTELIRAIEAILFAAGERVEISRLAAVFETDEDEIARAAGDIAGIVVGPFPGLSSYRIILPNQLIC